MAGVKISALPAVPSAPTLTDIFPEVQPASGGVTYKTTFQQLYDLFTTSSGTVNAGTADQLAYYATSGNTISGLATANSGVVVTNNAGVPLVLAGSGTTGTHLHATASGTPAWTTATFPSTATGTGTILRADGTNWLASTATYPDTTTANQILYSSSNNTIAGLASANSSVLVTSGGGVPSLSTTLPSGLSATNLTLTTPILGTPQSGTLTNCTGLPVSTGISGLGSGVATALATSVNGSGAISLTTSPTFVTPTLGAALATSINFGASTLNTYNAANSWTPSLVPTSGSFTTVTYSQRTAEWTTIGNLTFFNIVIQLSAFSIGTASGNLLINGLPVTPTGSGSNSWPFPAIVANVTFLGSTLVGSVSGGSSSMVLVGSATASSTSILQCSGLSATSYINLSGWFFIA